LTGTVGNLFKPKEQLLLTNSAEVPRHTLKAWRRVRSQKQKSQALVAVHYSGLQLNELHFDPPNPPISWGELYHTNSQSAVEINEKNKCP
jgi:hypothetical protein